MAGARPRMFVTGAWNRRGGCCGGFQLPEGNRAASMGIRKVKAFDGKMMIGITHDGVEADGEEVVPTIVWSGRDGQGLISPHVVPPLRTRPST